MDRQLKENQRRLSLLGLYDDRAIDGLMGRMTQRAIHEFCQLEGVQLEDYEIALWDKIQSLPVDDYWDADSLLPVMRGVCEALYLSMPEQLAYLMATVQHETRNTYIPVNEAFWLPEEARRRYLRQQPYGIKWAGRGLVQLTWEANYFKYSRITGLDLCAEPELLLDPHISLLVLVHGCKTGTFTGVGIERYINESKIDFVNARRVINGIDKAAEIAAIAKKWLNLIKGGEQ